MKTQISLILSITMTLIAVSASAASPPAAFGPSNPLYVPSTLPYQAPPFDRIKDADYQPAIEAGMAQQLKEIKAITDNPAAPTFDNTLVALEKSGSLLDRASAAFYGVSQANTNDVLQQAKADLAPKNAAHEDAIYLNEKLFARISAVYKQRASLKLDAESLRLLKFTYDEFVHRGANLSRADKATLKKLNTEAATLSNAFTNKILAATKEGAYTTEDRAALAGLTDAQLSAAAGAAKERNSTGYVLPLQNTTQQPDLASLSVRETRTALLRNSWDRAEKSDANDTRDTIARLAQLRAQRAKLLGFPNHAAWKLEDQMAKTPETALKFVDALVPMATAKAAAEGKEIQAVIDSQHGGFTLGPQDWNYYSEQVRAAKYALNGAEV